MIPHESYNKFMPFSNTISTISDIKGRTKKSFCGIREKEVEMRS
jgi:hypothetical protein